MGHATRSRLAAQAPGAAPPRPAAGGARRPPPPPGPRGARPPPGGRPPIVAGPALGGLLFAVRPELVYSVAAGLLAAALVATAALRDPAATRVAIAERAPGLVSVLEGLRFVRATPILLGAITLDLFAVLF